MFWLLRFLFLFLFFMYVCMCHGACLCSGVAVAQLAWKCLHPQPRPSHRCLANAMLPRRKSCLASKVANPVSDGMSSDLMATFLFTDKGAVHNYEQFSQNQECSQRFLICLLDFGQKLLKLVCGVTRSGVCLRKSSTYFFVLGVSLLFQIHSQLPTSTTQVWKMREIYHWLWTAPNFSSPLRVSGYWVFARITWHFEAGRRCFSKYAWYSVFSEVSASTRITNICALLSSVDGDQKWFKL